MFEEAAITINGTALTVGQSMTVRCALSEFFEAMVSARIKSVGGDPHDQALSKAYAMRAREVLSLISSPSAPDGGGS